MKRYRAIAEYYDFEYPPDGMLERDVLFFLSSLPRDRMSVLELAAGTARAALPIAQAGHRVVGVDYAADLLAIAARKRDAAGLRERDLLLHLNDVLDLDLGRRFDRVCLFFNTFLAFPTLAEQDRLLQVVRRHLKPGGRFWLDVFQPTHAALPDGVERDLEPTAFYVPPLARTVFKTTELRRDPVKQVQRVIFHYRWFDAAGRERRERTTFEMTVIFPRELQILLERNGLRLDGLWGDYDGSALSADSPRMIASCAPN